MSILFGHYVPDAGTIETFGHPLPHGSPRAALDAGIGMVHQHFTLADNLTVLDNVILGTESLWRLRSDRRKAQQRLETLSARFGLAVDPSAHVGGLSIGERQRVEILKALYREVRILILDEPTAVLTPAEAETLFATLRALARTGLSIIFISHKLDEVLRTSDRVVVLRRGRVVAERCAAATSRNELAELMVGRTVAAPRRQTTTPGEPVFELDGVSVVRNRRTLLDGVDLSIQAREILGVIGVAGNGQAALADLAGGLISATRGTVRLFGEAVTRANPGRFIAAGVARIPEDRMVDGAVADMSVWENAILETAHTPTHQRFGLLRRAQATSFARDLIARFDIRCPGPGARSGLLSGGNLQKLILGRVLAQDPRFIVAHQPTRGLDVGAIAFVQTQLLAARDRGAGVLLISEDLDEVLSLADRVAVIHRGRVSPPRPAHEVSPRELGLLMAGRSASTHHAA